jgi:RHS repeat-associated protein
MPFGSITRVGDRRTIASGWNVGYVYVAGQLMAQYRDSTTYFAHKDHLGSTHLVTKLDKSIYDSMDYLPFGEQIAGASGTSHKFTADERDAETSMDHTQFRQYSSSFGRWASPCPAGFAVADLSDPQSWNRYGYVQNAPTFLIDPFGLGNCPEELRGDCGPTAGGGSGPTGYDPVDTGNSGGHDQTGPGGSSRGGGAGRVSRVQCATQFGRNHSLAAGAGAIFGDKVGNNFVTQLFLGNTVSSVFKIGTDIFGGTTPTGSQVAGMALKGAAQGIPIPGDFPVKGVVGTVRSAGVQAAVGAGYNVLAGVGQETLELGLTTGKVATVAVPLASTALQTAASAVAIGKFVFDLGTFAYGAAFACGP